MSSQDADPTQPAITPPRKYQDELEQSDELGMQEKLKELELPVEQSIVEWLARNTISILITLTIALITGFVAGLLGPTAWHWFLEQTITPGHGTIIGGIFVVTAAAIAYTGTHLTRTSNERIANQRNELDTTNTQRAHDLTDTQELRRRFVTTTAQFADPSTEVRLAGVYALEALTDDWIDRNRHTDAQTCINYLSGYLTRPYAPPAEDPTLRTHTTRKHRTKYEYTDSTYEHLRDDLNVRQAITRIIANHLQPNHHHNWSNYNYDLTGAHFHNADFTGSHFKGTIDFTKANLQGEQTSFTDAEFHGERTSFTDAEFHSDRTSFEGAEFHSELTSFTDAEFHGDRTSFEGSEFHSDRTSFVDAEFHSKVTEFANAEFHGGEWTSFEGAEFHGEWTLFADAEFHGDLTSFEGAEFHGEWTLFADAEFHGDLTSFEGSEFHSDRTSFEGSEFDSELTSFRGSEFHSDRTSFRGAEFHSDRTSFEGAEFHSEWTSFAEADFHSDRTSFEGAEFYGEQTSFEGAEFHGERTSFIDAEFHSNRTSFERTEFHSERTSLGGAEFHSKHASFSRAEFHSKHTSFDHPRVWNNVYFDWDPRTPYAVTATKPDNITPYDWPPTVKRPK